ncbi:MAG: hypothetical protein HYU36_11580 [Planctomycetes bacterium]|nr:hypothetical protein [Planctomycetota bacterium]
MNTLNLHQSFRQSIRELSHTSPKTRPQPDDLDLSQMARNALNYLRGNPEPSRNYECKFSLGPLGIPCHHPEIAPPNQYGYDPVSLGDTDCRMDWQYTHMREMAGESEAESVERGVRRRVLSYLREDHLAWINPVAYIGQPIDGYWVGTWTSAKLLVSLSEDYARTGDLGARKQARAIFEALRNIAQWDGDKAYYWGIAPYKEGEWLLKGWCEEHGRNYPFIVEPCVRYGECTGDEEALDLARAFTEGFLAGSQPDQRELRIHPETGAFQRHVHCHTHAVWGVAHLGVVLGEQRYLDWARRVHEFVLANGTDFGWYPEFIPQGEYRTEICVVGDMVSLGAWLARGGWPHYWDPIERTIRNELRRSQFFLTPEFLDLFQRLHKGKPQGVLDGALADLRRLEGGFVAQASFDDWVSYPEHLGQAGLSRNGIQMMGCCPPEGMRGLWEAWCAIVEERPEGVFINMSLTRDHPAAKVTASLPEFGHLRVEACKSTPYYLRPPAWVERDQVALFRNGQQVPVTWGGAANAYVFCSAVSHGDLLELSYPVPSFIQTFTPTSVPKREASVTVRWVGNTVVGVKPRGKWLPMFNGAW